MRKVLMLRDSRDVCLGTEKQKNQNKAWKRSEFKFHFYHTVDFSGFIIFVLSSKLQAEE